MSCILSSRDRRKLRVRRRLRARNIGKLRLSMVKTNRHLYAQLIDDVRGRTLIFVSTNSNLFRETNSDVKTWCSIKCATKLGEMFKDSVSNYGLKCDNLKMYFDRGASPYTGVVKAFADKLRECGFRF